MTGPISFNPNINQAIPKRVAIVDDFTNKTIDIDGDSKPDLAHGEVAALYIKAYCPNVKIKPLDIGNSKSPDNIDLARMNQALHYINSNPGEFDAINLSGGYLMTIDDLNKSIDPKLLPEGGLTRENIHQHEELILKTMQKENPDAFENALGLFHIKEQGVEIYTAAGNNKNWYNGFGAVPGVQQVGGKWPSGKIASDSAEHKDVQAYEQFGFKTLLITDDAGKPAGYDINMDGKPDVPIDKTSSKGKFKGGAYIMGTSFSTPVHVGKKLNIVSK